VSRRSAIVVGVVVCAALGLMVTSITLLRSLLPSTGREPSNLDVSLAEIAPGSFRVVKWNSWPVAIVRPSAAMIEALRTGTSLTWDKKAIGNPAPRAFVFNKVSTAHLCTLEYAAPAQSHFHSYDHWPGGFFDPCDHGEWDYAGRALKPPYSAKRLADLSSPKYEITSKGVVRLLR